MNSGQVIREVESVLQYSKASRIEGVDLNLATLDNSWVIRVIVRSSQSHLSPRDMGAWQFENQDEALQLKAEIKQELEASEDLSFTFKRVLTTTVKDLLEVILSMGHEHSQISADMGLEKRWIYEVTVVSSLLTIPVHGLWEFQSEAQAQLVKTKLKEATRGHCRDLTFSRQTCMSLSDLWSWIPGTLKAVKQLWARRKR